MLDIIGHSLATRIEMTYTSLAPEIGNSQENLVQRWGVQANLVDVDDDLEDGEPEGEEGIGVFRFVKVDLFANINHYIFMDEYPEIEDAGLTIFNPRGNGLMSGVEKRLVGGWGRWALIGNGMSLVPHWRGYGIGRLLVAEAINRLRDDCRVVAFVPGPMQFEEDEELSDRARAVAKRKLAATWRSIGFENYRNGVMILNPTATALDDALQRLRTKFGLT